MITDKDICDRIHSYWLQRGYNIKVSVIECQEPGARGGVITYHAVRSTLINGLPRGYRGDRAPVERV